MVVILELYYRQKIILVTLPLIYKQLEVLIMYQIWISLQVDI